MKFIYFITTSFFFLALMHVALTLGLIVNLDLVFVYKILLNNCPTAILKALESLPVSDIITVAVTITATLSGI
jgi:hypothetical protein